MLKTGISLIRGSRLDLRYFNQHYELQSYGSGSGWRSLNFGEGNKQLFQYYSRTATGVQNILKIIFHFAVTEPQQCH